MPREDNLSKLKEKTFDVLIVGAGINGSVSAAALSAQGAKVCLIDQGDFGGQTSQESSNLVWGGIKYMENFEFGLVRKLCMARNRLLRAYPSSLKEIRFLTTIEKGFRFPPVILYAGAWLYWLIGNGFTRLPVLLGKKAIKNREHNIRVENVAGGFEYSDAYLPECDTRFVFEFVRKARSNGSVTTNYLESLGSERKGDLWSTQVRDVVTGHKSLIRSRILINACGPLVDDQNKRSRITTRNHHLFSKGIHLIINRIADENRILAFFASDGRLFFAIPMGSKSCVGTTDTRVDSLPPEVTAEDRRFVLDNINERLTLDPPLTEADIISERCGVRPLVSNPDSKTKDKGDWSSLSRKHAIEVDSEIGHVSIFGGKLTDCLNVGNEIIEDVAELGMELPNRDPEWFGEPPVVEYRKYLQRADALQIDKITPVDFSEPISQRLWRRYGKTACNMIEEIGRDKSMAEVIIKGSEYLRCELHYAAVEEMIVKLDDLLRRRTNISQTIRQESLQKDRGLVEACEVLFNNKGEGAFNEYFNSQ